MLGASTTQQLGGAVAKFGDRQQQCHADNTKTRADLATSAGVASLQILSAAQTAPASMSTYNVALTTFATTATAAAASVSMNAAGLASMTASLQGRAAPSGDTAIGDVSLRNEPLA